MNKAWAHKHGFTIVELLITIVIIAILAGITLIAYNGISQKSRDSRRDSDVTQIKLALEKYHADKGGYPAVCSGGDDTDCPASALATSLSSYLSAIPHDPSYTEASGMDYRYIKGSIANPSDPSAVDSYGILINYESKPVCKTGQNINTSWWTAAIPTC